MAADKNLFLYNLAVVAIMKNEGRYLKEWLDYHLAAGVEHFYIYDNESTDNQAEVAAPYVEIGLVDYFKFPGKRVQYPAYMDAVKRFKFHCRYMAFIDADEFICPKTGGSIAEIVDEILSRDEDAAALAVNWQIFGSNGQEKADYSRGVLERFTRRAPSDWTTSLKHSELAGGNAHVKTIANPRAVNLFSNPHYALYFGSFHAVNENGSVVEEFSNSPVTAEKIVVNHYFCKSREEFLEKQARGRSDTGGKQKDELFRKYDRNEEFDDGILAYCNARAENLSLEPNLQRFSRVIDALTETLLSSSVKDLETALTCRAVSAYLREKIPAKANYWTVCERAALDAILKSLSTVTVNGAKIFLRDLPNLLKVPYPAEVKEIRSTAVVVLSGMIDIARLNYVWDDYAQFDYLYDLLK